jgi:hypothetical protein
MMQPRLKRAEEKALLAASTNNFLKLLKTPTGKPKDKRISPSAFKSLADSRLFSNLGGSEGSPRAPRTSNSSSGGKENSRKTHNGNVVVLQPKAR